MLSATRRTISATMFLLSEDAVISRNTSSSAPSSEYRRPASTGSPASRRLTKLMPLTTRPSFTSRQGMIRLASIGQSLLDFDSSFVEGLADDDTVESPVVQLTEMPHIRNGRHAAGSDHGQLGVLQHLLRGRNIGTLENSISFNICVDDDACTKTLKTACEVDRSNV